MSRSGPGSWTAIVAMKSPAIAKSRLRPASASDAEHHRLVAAIRTDTLAAIGASRMVGRILVVSDTPGAGVDVVQARPGLNQAFAEATAWLRTDGREMAGVVLLVCDLPALRGADLDDVLVRAPADRPGFVADAEGHGTTSVVLADPITTPTCFGPRSAQLHAGYMTVLPADLRLRLDVDNPSDLARASRLGLGPHTAAVLAATAEPAGRQATARRCS